MIGSTSALNTSLNNSTGGGGTSSSNAFQSQFNTSTAQLTHILISSSLSVQQFDSIRKWLSKNHKKVIQTEKKTLYSPLRNALSNYHSIFLKLKYYDADPPANKVLMQFLCQLVQFQEDNLGRSATKPLPTMTRLPVILAKILKFFVVVVEI
jgi:hypothetical protein